MAPVADALAARGLSPILVLTGQHPDLQPADFGLDRFDSIRLLCPGRPDPHVQAGHVSRALAPILERSSAALVIVQGDTSSALGGMLGARLAGVPVAHVEAGLRSHNASHPWPEEEFRIAIDRESDLLFAPTELSAANLRRERVSGLIHVTGNSGIDSLEGARPGLPAFRRCTERKLLVTCHRRENWGPGIDRLASALVLLADEDRLAIDIVLHPNPDLARHVRARVAGRDTIACRGPCSHKDLLDSMMNASLVLSDSGGLQEEAAALGVPLLLLRDSTERPEAIACGAVELVGTDTGRIVAAVRRRLKARRNVPASLPFGDGCAGERIAAIIVDWLAHRQPAGPNRPIRPESSARPSLRQAGGRHGNHVSTWSGTTARNR